MTERGKQTPGSPFLMVATSIHSQRHTLYLRDWPRVDVIQLDGEEFCYFLLDTQSLPPLHLPSHARNEYFTLEIYPKQKSSAV